VPIASAVLTGNGLYLSSALGSTKISFGPDQPGTAVPMARLEQSALPSLPPNSNLLSLNDRELLFWDGSRAPKLGRLDLAKDSVVKTGPANAGSFLSVRVIGSQVCTVDTGGGINVWNALDFKNVSRSTAQRAACATVDDAGRLLVGLGASGPTDTTLQSVNLKTNETIPLASSGSLLFQALADPSGRSFHSLSLANAGPTSLTRWEVQAMDSLVAGTPRQATTIMEAEGEDIGADLIHSAAGQRWYSSLGGLVVCAWDGAKATKLEAANHTPRRLSVNRDWLASLNGDGSVSIFETAAGRLVADIWLTASGQVLLLDRNQRWILASRISGNKVAPADPKERSAVMKWLCLPMGTPGRSDEPATWEGQLPLSLD
jgi:hypothetical protein